MFIIETFAFLAAVLLIIGAGFFLLGIFFPGNVRLLTLETWLLSAAFGVGLLDFAMILAAKAGLALTGGTILIILSALIGLSFATFLVISCRKRPARSLRLYFSALPFTRLERVLFILLIGLTFLVKVTYLDASALPTSTDLGHHMYWSKLITETGALPDYEKRELVELPNGGASLSAPRPIADFIIGEHLPFAAISLLTGISFFSAFPISLLLLFNLGALLALALLAYRIAERFPDTFLRPAHAFLSVLFLLGPLYTLASPQAKFVSGGVVGNTIGNFLIPVILLLFLRALEERLPSFLAAGLFLVFTLAYTHHLSTLILVFILFAWFLLTAISRLRSLGGFFRELRPIVFSAAPLIVTTLAILFFFLVAMPTYIETNAVTTAIGTPEKLTRTGLSLDQLSDAGGVGRIALALFMTGIMIFAFRSQTYAWSLALSFLAILFVMSFRPDWLFLDIPSNRIGAYFSFPIIIAAGLALAVFTKRIHGSASPLMASALLVITIAYAATTGTTDNGQSLSGDTKIAAALETYDASRFLATRVAPGEEIIKDHNYLAADAWMKLFFMRGYDYPLSRGFFKRYEEDGSRDEQCTLAMISTPNTPQGTACYDTLRVRYAVVNPIDAGQFEASGRFSRIYASPNVHIYDRR